MINLIIWAIFSAMCALITALFSKKMDTETRYIHFWYWVLLPVIVVVLFAYIVIEFFIWGITKDSIKLLIIDLGRKLIGKWD